MIGRCAIYETRPEFCRAYPTATDWRPVPCTYGFAADGTRTGECRPDVCAAENCCAFPREGGEPLALPIAPAATTGGLPCRHLRGLGRRALPHRPLAQVSAHALWVGEVMVEREGEGEWGVSLVRAHAVHWTLSRIPTAKLEAQVGTDGWLRATITVPARQPLQVALSPQQVAALWRLLPRRSEVEV